MRPLEGLKVLDFFWVVIGPMTTGYLAEYGATVVRVESQGRPEVLRTAPAVWRWRTRAEPQCVLCQLQCQ